MHTLCRGAAATLKQVPPWADTATSCNATPCTTTRSDLKQSRATPSQRCTWTIKLCLSAQKIKLALTVCPNNCPVSVPQNWLVLLYTILCYVLTVEISRPVQRFAPKRYKYYSLQQSSSTLVLFIQDIYILSHVGCCHNPSPLLPVSRTVADHTSFTPCMVSNRIKTEGERAVLTDLGIPATGLQVLAHFSLQKRI